MENINLKNIILPNRKFDKNHIAIMADKMLIDNIRPCFTVIQVPNSSEEKFYRLYPASKKQALFLAAVKQANILEPLEKSYSHIFCQVIWFENFLSFALGHMLYMSTNKYAQKTFSLCPS